MRCHGCAASSLASLRSRLLMHPMHMAGSSGNGACPVRQDTCAEGITGHERSRTASGRRCMGLPAPPAQALLSPFGPPAQAPPPPGLWAAPLHPWHIQIPGAWHGRFWRNARLGHHGGRGRENVVVCDTTGEVESCMQGQPIGQQLDRVCLFGCVFVQNGLFRFVFRSCFLYSYFVSSSLHAQLV